MNLTRIGRLVTVMLALAAMLQSAVLMLRHLGEREAADRVHEALENVYRKKENLTRDVGGTASTTEFAEAVIAAMSATVAA